MMMANKAARDYSAILHHLVAVLAYYHCVVSCCCFFDLKIALILV